jgi:hypothetical protein
MKDHHIFEKRNKIEQAPVEKITEAGDDGSDFPRWGTKRAKGRVEKPDRRPTTVIHITKKRLVA